MENKPLEWDEYMKPYREKRLFCKTVKRRIMPTYTDLDIIAGLKEAGYTEYEAQHYLEVIKEKKKGSLTMKLPRVKTE